MKQIIIKSFTLLTFIALLIIFVVYRSNEMNTEKDTNQKMTIKVNRMTHIKPEKELSAENETEANNVASEKPKGKTAIKDRLQDEYYPITDDNDNAFVEYQLDGEDYSYPITIMSGTKSGVVFSPKPKKKSRKLRKQDSNFEIKENWRSNMDFTPMFQLDSLVIEKP